MQKCYTSNCDLRDTNSNRRFLWKAGNKNKSDLEKENETVDKYICTYMKQRDQILLLGNLNREIGNNKEVIIATQ